MGEMADLAEDMPSGQGIFFNSHQLQVIES